MQLPGGIITAKFLGHNALRVQGPAKTGRGGAEGVKGKPGRDEVGGEAAQAWSWRPG